MEVKVVNKMHSELMDFWVLYVYIGIQKPIKPECYTPSELFSIYVISFSTAYTVVQK
jgi:hypothetical protein